MQNDDEIIQIKKKEYISIMQQLQKQKAEIEDLKSIINEGDISVTVDKIHELKSLFDQKAPVLLYSFSLYPIGQSERGALGELIEEMELFIKNCINYLKV